MSRRATRLAEWPMLPWERLYLPGRPLGGGRGEAYARAEVLVRIFYIYLAYHAFLNFPQVRDLVGRTEAELLWPVRWMAHAPWKGAVISIWALMMGGALSAMTFPGNGWTRLLAFVGVFQFESLANSFGKINHSHHLLVLIGLVFILLPRTGSAEGGEDEEARRRYLETFWAAQAIVLLTYTLAGLSKFRGAWLDMRMLQPSLFSIDALATQIAYDLVNSNKTTLLGLGEAIIAHPLAGFPLFLGASLLELLSVFVAWRPNWHRLWGLGLIGLHLGIGLTMEVYFFAPIFVLGLMLVASPFADAVGGAGVGTQEALASGGEEAGSPPGSRAPG